MLGEQYRVKSDTGSNTAAQVKLMNMRKPSGNHSSEKTKAETQKKEDGQREAKPKNKTVRINTSFGHIAKEDIQ